MNATPTDELTKYNAKKYKPENGGEFGLVRTNNERDAVVATVQVCDAGDLPAEFLETLNDLGAEREKVDRDVLEIPDVGSMDKLTVRVEK